MKTNLRIGEVLMERNYITQEQMEQALAYQKEHREKRVGQILIELSQLKLLFERLKGAFGIPVGQPPAAHQPPGVALRLFGAGAEAHQRRERLVGRFVAFFPYFSRVHTMRGFPKRSSRTSVSVYPSAPSMRTISAAARS